MPKVIMYTTQICPFCVRAKRLLDSRGVSYEEVDVTDDDLLREKMVAESGRRTVPQIFFGDRSIGGFEELYALDRSGQLEELLAGG